ncbi:serine hydrolase domain-containing protein [Streptomyces sp. SBT349]|uniref:serine hydrolase domain-containing protein n=1 Tax=Streptomyces sp. SBT349 TaxID=1580539 RepID=UPI00066DF161|nr:serine hydrolase domain-containing protein [Streptomyces sp. SBT349]
MHRKRNAVALPLAAALAAVAATVGAAPPDGGGAPNPVQRQLDLLVEEDGVPGALAHSGRDTVTAGTSELGSGRPMVGAEGRFRIASVTKPFTATAVMRLVADGELRLDDAAGRYVPQLAGSEVTLRQLLKQTSGLAEYGELVDWDRSHTQEEYLALSLGQGPAFEPGQDWGYSNTNYLVLGMAIERVTGEDVRTHIERTILDPLDLDETYWPEPGELGLRGPHAHNYGVHPARPEDGVVDVTELPGYEFGASGGLVSTPEDLNAFWDALFGGRLLPGWAVRLMTHDTTDVGDDGYPQGSRYGYGVQSSPLSCGGAYWGHLGDLPGNSVASGHATGGRGSATVYITAHWSGSPDRAAHLQAAADAALCATDTPRREPGTARR